MEINEKTRRFVLKMIPKEELLAGGDRCRSNLCFPPEEGGQ